MRLRIGPVRKGCASVLRLCSTGAILTGGLVVMMTIAFLWMSSPTTAEAASLTFPDGTLVKSANTVINPKQRVEEVLVIGHDVTVYGRVSDNLVVLNGNVQLRPGASVGLVLDIGGRVDVATGASTKDVVSIGYRGPFQNSLAVGAAGLTLWWMIRITLSAALVAVPVVGSLLLRPWLSEAVDYLRSSARRSGVAGLLSTAIFVGVGLLFAISMIGLPLAALDFVVYAVAGALGLSVVSFWIGGMVTREFSGDRTTEFGRFRPDWMKALFGATFIMAFSNVPLFGPLLLLVLWMLGLGTISLWLVSKWRFRRSARKS